MWLSKTVPPLFKIGVEGGRICGHSEGSDSRIVVVSILMDGKKGVEGRTFDGRNINVRFHRGG